MATSIRVSARQTVGVGHNAQATFEFPDLLRQLPCSGVKGFFPNVEIFLPEIAT